MSCWGRFGSRSNRRGGCGRLRNGWGRRRHASLCRSRLRDCWPQPRRFRRSVLGFLLCFGRGLRLSLGFRNSLNAFPDLLGNVSGNRARVRLFFRDTEARQKINDRFGLHFQFAGQLVDSDLVRVAHALRSLLGPFTPVLLLPLVTLRFRFP